ncbi:MAG: fasciclin domain-containing protein [Patescibacteria group bacterium]
MSTIVDLAVKAGTFKTLVAAVKAADLVSTLSGPGPFTVFAPTDDAFAKLPAGTVQSLLEDKAKLTAVLTYHVVGGSMLSGDVLKQKSLTTAQGSPLPVTVSDGVVMVGQAKVLKTDSTADNGVIHVIDSVLIPE